MYFAYFHSFVPPKSSSMRITQEYLYLLESFYQNFQVSGGKWHMSHLISCPIAWEIDSKLISVQLDHPVTQKPDNIVSRMHSKLNAS